MHFERNEVKSLIRTIKQITYYILSFSVILLAGTMSGCFMNNPAHGSPIEGDIEISKNSEGSLCFMPLFSSATIMGNSTDLKYIKMTDLDILDLNAADVDSKIIRVRPANKKYFILKNGEKVCLNSDNPELDQFVNTPLNKQELLVSIGGLDDKEELVVTFQKEFDHPYDSD